MIRRQDSVMVEKALDKVLDFAMLFHAGNGRVSLSGYSAFVAENGVAYSGNLVMPDCKIKNEYIGRYISPSVLDELESALPPILSELIGDIYNGYFGVDMMVYRDDSGDYAVAPCVEVNLRMTMGVVAHRLGKRYVSPDVDARMKVTFGRYFTDGDAVIDGGRLVSGSMSLIEPDPYFSITLEVIKR